LRRLLSTAAYSLLVAAVGFIIFFAAANASSWSGGLIDSSNAMLHAAYLAGAGIAIILVRSLLLSQKKPPANSLYTPPPLPPLDALPAPGPLPPGSRLAH
jgi:hypothetical protein